MASSDVEDLEPALLSARFSGRRSLDFDGVDVVERRRVLAAADILDSGTGPATIAGLMCFGRRPQDRLPYAMVTCTAFPGTTLGREMSDRVDALGRVDEQIGVAVDFVERNLRAPSIVSGIRRLEAPRHPPESFREAVDNAVAHRHYGIAGPSQLRVFCDRVEMISPGAPRPTASPRRRPAGGARGRSDEWGIWYAHEVPWIATSDVRAGDHAAHLIAEFSEAMWEAEREGRKYSPSPPPRTRPPSPSHSRRISSGRGLGTGFADGFASVFGVRR